MIPIGFHIAGLGFAFALGYLVKGRIGNVEPSQPVNAPVSAPMPAPAEISHEFFFGPAEAMKVLAPVSPKRIVSRKIVPIQTRKPLIRTRGAKLEF